MNNKNENEMEQIQRGLEDFLEKELDQMGKSAPAGQGSRTGTQHGQASRRQNSEDSVRIIGQQQDEDEVDYGRDGGYSAEHVRSRQDGYHRRDDYNREDAQYRQESRSRRDGYSGGGADEEAQYFRGTAYDHREGTGNGRRGYNGTDTGRRGYDEEEEDPESAVYDWDSEAPRRRNSGQQRTHTHPDSDYVRSGYVQEDRDSRAYGQESGYSRNDYGEEDRGSRDYAQESRYPRNDYGGEERDPRGYGQEGRHPRRDYGDENRDSRNYGQGGRAQRHDYDGEDGGARDDGQENRYSHRDYGDEGRGSRNRSREDRYARHASDREDRDARTSHRREENIPSGRQDRGREQPPKRKARDRQAQPREEDYQVADKTAKSQRSQKKKRKKKHRLLKFLIAVAVIFVLLGAGLYHLVGVVYGKMTYHEIASLTQAPMKEDGVVNVLLIGNDSRENGEDGRSDAMILLSISNKTKKIYMTSLLRDMYVDIPGHDGNRLNAAYSFGGAELLMETIEQNLDITVNRYVLVNFEAFANLVDAVGGIELDLTSEEIEYVNGYLVEYNILTNRPQGTDNMDTSVSGLVHLNGPQALAYSRNRYLGTDFGRTDRQRKVLTAVIHKLPSALVTNPKGLMDGLLPNLTTNLTRGECFSLSLMAGKMLTYDIESDSIPQPGTYRDVTIRKMAVLEVDFDANIQYLKEKLYGE